MQQRDEEEGEWVRELLQPTIHDFSKNFRQWSTVRGSRDRNNLRVNDDQPCLLRGQASWDVADNATVMLWRDRDVPGTMDAELLLESEEDLLPEERRHRFPFLAGLAGYHSAHIRSMMALHAQQQQQSLEGEKRKLRFVISKYATKEPAVLACLQFYLVTSLLVDVHRLTKEGTVPIAQALTYDDVKNPEFSFDLLVTVPIKWLLVMCCAMLTVRVAAQDLYHAAAYLRMHKLTKKLREHCLFGAFTAVAPYHESERMLASIIARVARTSIGGEEELLPSAIAAYVRMTKGLACLCKWPLAFEKKVWDAMMQEAASTCHHWIAHVLPLYALLFPEACGQGTSLILMVRANIPLMQAAEKSMKTHLSEGCDLRGCSASDDLGILHVVHGTCIPYVQDLAFEYRERYGIDLRAALQRHQVRTVYPNKQQDVCVNMMKLNECLIMFLEQSESPDKNCGPWILDWLHVLAATAQLLCAMKEPKISECIPSWLAQSLQLVMQRYAPYADSMDLAKFEAACAKRDWRIEPLIVGSAAAANDPRASGGDLVKICILEYINRHRRTKNQQQKQQPTYFVGLMDSISLGMGLAIRLRSSGSVIRAPGEVGNKKRGRKRTAAEANNGEGDQPSAASGSRPNYCDALNFGGLASLAGGEDSDSDMDADDWNSPSVSSSSADTESDDEDA